MGVEVATAAVTPAPVTPTLSAPLICSQHHTCHWGYTYMCAHHSFRISVHSCTLRLVCAHLCIFVLVRAHCCHPCPSVVATLMGHPMVFVSKTLLVYHL